MKKSDRRVQRTKHKLNQALLQLIRQQRYELISVQDITRQAGLSRATFYLHYQDKDALLHESLERLLNDIIGRIQALTTPTDLLSDVPALQIYQLVADNQDLYRVLLSEQGGSVLGPRLRQTLAKGIEEWLRSIGGPPLEQQVVVPLDLLSGYTANALFGLIAWWLDNDMPHSVAYMAHMTRQLNMFGIMPFLMGASIQPHGI